MTAFPMSVDVRRRCVDSSTTSFDCTVLCFTVYHTTVFRMRDIANASALNNGGAFVSLVPASAIQGTASIILSGVFSGPPPLYDGCQRGSVKRSRRGA